MSPTESARPFTMPFVRGQVINGKYEVLELVGVGGLGFVVAATHLELGETVALKFLRPEALANAEAVGRFAREARASAKIQSEHVARVFDVGTLPEGAPFIVMEYLEGSDLGVLLQQRGALPVAVAIEYVLQTCEALAAAHARGIVHRDIKPDNLFLHSPAPGVEVIKVLDFGISKLPIARTAFEARHPLVETTTAMGSPIYMSPEQIRASKNIDSRTDIWSLGCVLFELLTNQLAFEAPSVTEVSALILESPSPSLRAKHPEVPGELDPIIQRCLAKPPDERFQNVAELAAELAPFASARGRIAIERCYTLLQGAGLARVGSSPPSTARARLPSSLPPDVMPAASTAALETLAPTSRTPTRKWPWSIAALLVTSSAAGLFVSGRLGGSDADDPVQPLAAPEEPRAAPPPGPASEPAPSMTTSTAASTGPLDEAPPGGSAASPFDPASPDAAEAPETAVASAAGEASAGEASAGEASASAEAPAPGATPPETSAEREPAADAKTPASPAEAPARAKPDGPPRAEAPKPKPVAATPPRRRASPPAHRPRPAPPRPPAPREEPDVGF